MNALIIEDESIIAEKLRISLQNIAPHIDILAVLPSVKAARRWFMQYPVPDLLFMDIQLSDGLSFELFNYFDIRCPVIFTTAYDEYALKAFKVNSIDYLLKPVDEEELTHALEKLKDRQLTPRLPSEFIRLMTQQTVQPTRTYKEKLLVHQRNHVVMIEIAEIALIYRDEIIFMLRKDGQTFVSDYPSLDEMTDILDPMLFFRANRTQLVNIQAVDSFRQDSTGKLHLRLKVPTNTLIEISREKAPQFRRWIDR